EVQSEKYKDSNCKQYTCFDCRGKVMIRVDTVLSIAKVNIYHNCLHLQPDHCVKMLSKILEEIRKYMYLTTIELTNHLHRQEFDISKYLHKRIYYWKSIANKYQYQRYDDLFLSSCKLLKEYESQDFYKFLEIQDIESTSIAFTTPLLKNINDQNIKVTEAYIDITYKTACGRYELYSIIVYIKGAGFLIAYIFMDTTKSVNSSTSTEKCSQILESFLEHIKSYNIHPLFAFTNKDFAKINAISNV
ncbi:4286_t:CDS:1, partial [Scutellospora calospora]